MGEVNESQGKLLGRGATTTFLKWLRVDGCSGDWFGVRPMVGVTVLMNGGRARGRLGDLSDGFGSGACGGGMQVE